MTLSSDHSQISKWYFGQCVFITGGTGFMGKILVEKLLRSCPGIKKIYLLIRNKKGRDIQQRLDDLLNSPVFDKIRDQNNSEQLLRKLQCFQGDITQTNCQFSQEDLQLLRETTTTIFHMAANVRFDQQLKPALLMNTGGTRNILEMACTFQKLKAFVHVSTSYCHCEETELEERLYPAPHDPLNMLDLVNWMDPELIKMLTPKLLGTSPNTYAYTKCLTEALVAQYSTKLPLTIVRPSIVVAVWKEPIAGWVDNLNGPTGLMVGAGKGVIRSMHCNPELNADLVPVDVSINSILIAAWRSGTTGIKNDVEVYHVTSDKEQTLSWGETLEMGKRHFFNNPFSVCLWYPGGSIKSSYFLHALAVFFFHLIPAYLVDFLMVLTRNKPFLVQTQKRIKNGLGVLQYYTTRPWYFHNEKLGEIWDKLGEKDKEIFYISRGDIDWEEYMLNYVLGARKYCVHEEPETIPNARRILRRLYYIDLVKNILFYGLVLWIFIAYATSFLMRIENPFEYFNGTLYHHYKKISI